MQRSKFLGSVTVTSLLRCELVNAMPRKACWHDLILRLPNSIFQWRSRLHVLAARCARGVPKYSALPKRRAQGRPGGRCTRGPRAKEFARARVDHRYRRWSHRPSPRSGLRLTSGSPRWTSVCHRHPRIILRELSACMGAPGPHDFAVRKRRRSSVGAFASTASPPHVSW